MNYSKELFRLSRNNISIYIDLGFDRGDLLPDGQDIGKTVEEAWGDSDYEYQVRVKSEHIPMLFRALGIDERNSKELVDLIAREINGNFSYRDFQKFLGVLKIPFETFTY